jgi:hypothetical protein
MLADGRRVEKCLSASNALADVIRIAKVEAPDGNV